MAKTVKLSRISEHQRDSKRASYLGSSRVLDTIRQATRQREPDRQTSTSTNPTGRLHRLRLFIRTTPFSSPFPDPYRVSRVIHHTAPTSFFCTQSSCQSRQTVSHSLDLIITLYIPFTTNQTDHQVSTQSPNLDVLTRATCKSLVPTLYASDLVHHTYTQRLIPFSSDHPLIRRNQQSTHTREPHTLLALHITTPTSTTDALFPPSSSHNCLYTTFFLLQLYNKQTNKSQQHAITTSLTPSPSTCRRSIQRG